MSCCKRSCFKTNHSSCLLHTALSLELFLSLSLALAVVLFGSCSHRTYVVMRTQKQQANNEKHILTAMKRSKTPLFFFNSNVFSLAHKNVIFSSHVLYKLLHVPTALFMGGWICSFSVFEFSLFVQTIFLSRFLYWFGCSFFYHLVGAFLCCFHAYWNSRYNKKNGNSDDNNIIFSIVPATHRHTFRLT